MRQYDALIIGGGPGGASCAVWLARLGFSPLLIESAGRLGGLERSNPFQDNWIAVLPGMTGQQVASNIERSVADACVETRLDARVRSVRRQGGGFAAQYTSTTMSENGGCEEVYGKTLVIASGVGARPLPGQASGEHFPGVLIGPGVHITEQDFKHKSVAILGGGDNAFENYSYVRDRGAAEVHLYARSVRAQAQWVDRARTVDVRVGPFAVEPAERRINGRHYDLVLVFYGWEPHAPFADALTLSRDDKGFFTTNSHTAETSVSGVYAIGEVARRSHPCVVTALADGVVAAKAIQSRLEG